MLARWGRDDGVFGVHGARGCSRQLAELAVEDKDSKVETPHDHCLCTCLIPCDIVLHQVVASNLRGDVQS